MPRVKRHARELGVEYGAARIADNRYRWGSCTVRDNVNFNWRLIKAPFTDKAKAWLKEHGQILEEDV